jgi:hypothetical protein
MGAFVQLQWQLSLAIGMWHTGKTEEYFLQVLDETDKLFMLKLRFDPYLASVSVKKS